MEDSSYYQIEKYIYLIHGSKVMLDVDLATLYGVELKHLRLQIKRNKERFPEDFMFQLTSEDMVNFKIRTHTTNGSLAFTENGVAMLSSVLRSERAIQVNIAIMRIFTRLRSFLMIEQELRSDLSRMKSDTSKMFKIVFERLDSLEEPESKTNRKKIGLK